MKISVMVSNDTVILASKQIFEKYGEVDLLRQKEVGVRSDTTKITNQIISKGRV
jgi:hypothetical protein